MTNGTQRALKKLIKENERLCEKCNLLMKENAELKFKLNFNKNHTASIIEYEKKKEKEVETLKELIKNYNLKNV